MKSKFKYGEKNAKDKYNLLVDDMLYNIIVNLRENGLSIDDLAYDLGITTEELLMNFTGKRKDFFVELESIFCLEEKGIYKNYSRLRYKK